MKLSIAFRIGLLTFLLTSIGIFSVAYLSFENTSETLKKQSVLDIRNDILRESELLSEKLQILREDVLFLSNVPPLGGIMRAKKYRGYDPDENTTGKIWKNRLEKIFKSVLKNREYYEQIRFVGISDKGREIVRVEYKNGKVVAQSRKILQQKIDRYYLTEALKLKEGEVYFSKIDLNREHGEIEVPHRLMLRAAVPIYGSGSGKPFGVVIINANFNKMAQAFKKERESGYYFIANNDGEYLLHPDNGRRYQFEFGQSYTIENDFPVKPEEIDNLRRKGEFKFLDIPKEGIGVFFQHLHINDSDKHSFIILGAVADYSTLHASSRTAQKRITVIAMGVALVITLLVGFVAFVVARPISILKKAVDRISSGETDVEIPDVGSDEIGSFANSMRGMLESVGKSEADLRELAASLEIKVAARTKELAESESKYRNLFESSLEAVMLLNSEKFIDCNDATLTVFGCNSPEDFMGRHPSDFSPPVQADGRSSRDSADEKIATAFRDGKNFFEWTHCRADGEEFTAEVLLMPTLLKGETVLQAIVRDISDRKKAEIALAVSEKKYRTLIENTNVVAWEYDWQEKRFIYVSENVALKFGYTQEEWCEKDFWIDHIHSEDREFAFSLCARASEKGEDHDFEYRLIHADGDVVWVRDIVSVMMEEDRPAILRGFLLDITERKIAEIELVKAKEAAEEATKLKDKFVSLVSHDLRGPLGTMMGLINFALNDKKEPQGEESKRILKSAVSSGNKMLTMIKDLLSISRLKTGKLVPNPEFLDARIIVEYVLANVGHQAKSKGITLTNEIVKNSRIYADRSLLTEVIQNLVSNAIKFCGKGDAVKLFIPAGKQTTIAVADSGSGISPDDIENIFSYEEKTSTAGTAGETGTGLGLPLSKDIMEAHGGTLTVASELAGGTTFYAELPFVKPRVMVVDDDEDVRTLYTFHLNKLDVEIVEAENGVDALEKMEGSLPHLILTDIKMPKMDGLELLKKLKGNAKFDKIAVIVITSMNDEDVRTKATQLRCDEYIVKPIDPSNFISRVKRYIA